nr:hypothetical protein CFP56_11793 [Quercus suber]
MVPELSKRAFGGRMPFLVLIRYASSHSEDWMPSGYHMASIKSARPSAHRFTASSAHRTRGRLTSAIALAIVV